MKTPTVYQMVSRPTKYGDRIMRMALHPGLDDQPQGIGRQFPFRITWQWYPYTSIGWLYSCRGVEVHWAGDVDMACVCAKCGSNDPHSWCGMLAGVRVGVDGSDASALAWLLEGE